MVQVFYIILFLFLLASPAEAKRKHLEKIYAEAFCEQLGGEEEYILLDRTRIDCLTKEYAIEVDFADKWAECAGAPIHYAFMTCQPGSKVPCVKPACALILENPENDKKYLKRIHNMNIFEITPEILPSTIMNIKE